QGGLDRDLRRLAVADLADHYHVGIRAQNRPQRRRERQAGTRVDLYLVHAAEPELDRVLDGDDVDAGVVDLRKRGVQRRRLTRAGGPRHEDRAGRPADDLRDLRAHVLGEAEIRERRRLLRLVEETHDDR